MKKKIVSTLLLLALALLVTACGKKDQPASSTSKETGASSQTEAKEDGKPVEIEFWHAMSGGNGETLEKLVAKFNETHKGIVVKPIFQGHYKDLFQKLSASSQTGNLPTLSMIYGNRLTAYVMNKMVEPLDAYVNDPQNGFDKKIWDDIPVGLRDDGIWDGVRYSLPFNKGAYLMYYNVDALKEHQLEPPKTWDELRQAAKALTDQDHIGLVFNKSVGIDSSFWVEQAGGHIYDKEQDKVLIDSPAVKEAFSFLTGMIKDGIATINMEEGYITGPMSRKESFIGFASSSNIPHMKEACEPTGVKWAVAKLPAGKKQAALFSGTDITMFNTSSPEQKKAAFEFLKFWFETETQTEWGINSGYMPLTNAALNSEKMQKYIKEEDPSKGIAAEMFDYAYQDPNALNGYAIHSNMQKALEEVVSGQKDLDQALKDAQANAVKEMEEAKRNVAK